MSKNNFKKEKGEKWCRGFTQTPSLALLPSFLVIFLKAFSHIIKTFFMSSTKKSNKKTMPNLVSGFTLIELMVATSLFVVVILASMGALFTLLDTAKNSRALRFAMDNVNFAMESMTRSIRMGTNYYCVNIVDGSMPSDSNLDDNADCYPTGGTLVAFVPQSDPDHWVGYKLSQVSTDKFTLKRCENGSCVPIVSPDVNVDSLKFFVKGSGEDSIQASVYIMMKGTVLVKGVPTSFAVQTMASQRNF